MAFIWSYRSQPTLRPFHHDWKWILSYKAAVTKHLCMYVYSDYCIRNSCKFKFKDTFCALIISKHFCSDNLLCVCLLGFYLGNCRWRWTKGIKSFEGCLRHHIWILVRIAAEIPSGGKKALSIHYTVPSHLYIVKRYYVYKVRRHGTVYIYRGAWKKKYGLPWPVTACLNQHSDRAYCFLQ